MSIPLQEKELFDEREQEAKKLFGFTISKDSDNLYRRIGQPLPAELPKKASRRIGADYAKTHNEESGAIDLLLFGLSDTQTFVLNIIDQHPDIPFERALQIGQHERTIKALAVIARQRQVISSAMISHPGDAYDLSSDKLAIEVSSSINPSYRNGCPAVEVVGGEVAPWPLFQRFAPWAAKLAIISYYDHK
jgi:hypothetical protein